MAKIPVLPISWDDAQPLLAASMARWFRKPGAARCLLTYHLGAGRDEVHIEW